MSLQFLDDFLASSTTSEHLEEPTLYGRYDGLGMDGSCASSQSDNSFLALMLGSGRLPSQPPGPGSLAAVAALPNGLTTSSLAGPGRAVCAEQPPSGSESPCLEASPELADPMLDDLHMQADSSDCSAEWFSAAHAQPFGIEASPLQQTAQPLPIPGKKRGRPRRYDTTLPLGEHSLASCLYTINGSGTLGRLCHSGYLQRWSVYMTQCIALWVVQGDSVESISKAATGRGPLSCRRGGSSTLWRSQMPIAVCAGTMDAHMTASVATVNGMVPGVRKRGAKPKYKFMTAEEAVAHRFIQCQSLHTVHPTHRKSCLCSICIMRVDNLNSCINPSGRNMSVYSADGSAIDPPL